MDMNNTLIVADDGSWVNSKHERLASIIQDYDSEMFLVWIPYNMREAIQGPPYAILHRPRDRKEYIVFTITEEEMDRPDEILAKLFRGDLTKNPNILADLDARNAAQEAIRLKEKMDAAEMRQDLVASIVGSHKHTFKHNGKVFRK
jgi:hypothetical protein